MGGEKRVQAKKISSRKPKQNQTESVMEIKIHCAHDALVKIKDLKPHPKNRNKHPSDQIARLAEIITYQGIRAPIKVSRRSGFITAGHGRLAALKRLKMKEVPVNYQDYATDEQEYADLQSDNAIASWSELDLSGILSDVGDLGDDFNLNMLGIKGFEFSSDKDAGCDEDEIPEIKDPFVKANEIWQLGNHRLMCGDAKHVEAIKRLMAGDKADMVFTDPPYGISVVGGGEPFGSVGGGKICKPGIYKHIQNDDTPETAIAAFNTARCLSANLEIWWGGNYYSHQLPASKRWLVWDKKTTGNFADCELAWTNMNGAVRKFEHQWNGLIKESERGTKRIHPTQKPIALCEWALNEIGESAKNIVDIFGGSGSTLIACEKTNRKCFMMEIDPHYCSVIIERWQKYTGKKAKRINGKKATRV